MTEKIKKYFDCSPTKYAVLVKFNLAQDFSSEGEMEQQLTLVLAEGDMPNSRTLTVNFFGVRDLKFNQPELSLLSFGFIDIRKNDLGYFVIEDEGHLKFSCRDFDCDVT